MCCLPLLELSPPLTCLEFDSVCFSSTDPIALHKTQVIWLIPRSSVLAGSHFFEVQEYMRLLLSEPGHGTSLLKPAHSY